MADAVFEPNSPLLTCPDLTLLMDYFLCCCETHPESKASENTWQEFYDALLKVLKLLCRAKGFDFRGGRNLADKTGTTVGRKRPDYILQYKGLVLMRGEEKRASEPKSMALEELTSKMCRWNVMLYGDLPYILGYATSGDDLEVVAIERTDGVCRSTSLLEFSIFEDRACALKAFYNLALLLHQMAKLTKRAYACGLEPFVPDVNDKRSIELLDRLIVRTIKPTQCSGPDDFKRLVHIYKTLEGLQAEGSAVTHLQTVESSGVKRNGSLVVNISSIGYLRYPTSDEVGEWLCHMLTALTYWHGRGYCHGDLRWRNIVVVPTAGSNYWMLIDMDESRQPDSAIIQWLHPFNGQKLRFQHDLYQLGKLMQMLPFELPDDLKAMQTILLSEVNAPNFTAESALEELAKTCTKLQ